MKQIGNYELVYTTLEEELGKEHGHQWETICMYEHGFAGEIEENANGGKYFLLGMSNPDNLEHPLSWNDASGHCISAEISEAFSGHELMNIAATVIERGQNNPSIFYLKKD